MDWFAKRTVGDVAHVTASRFGDRCALVSGDHTWSWSEFADEVDRVAAGLMALGVGLGDHVGLWMTNRPEWLFAMYAIPRVGAVTVPLNTRYRLDDATYAIDQSDTTVLLTIDRSGPVEFASMLEQMLPNLPNLRQVITLGEPATDRTMSWSEMVAAGSSVSGDHICSRAASVDPDDPMIIVYTSGTTSAPKGAVHRHIWLRRVAERASLLGLHHRDTHLSFLPLFHAYGYSEIAATTALTGACQILMENFDPDVALDLAEQHQSTILHGFDTHYQDMLTSQAAMPRNLAFRLGTLPAGMDNTRTTAYRVQDLLCPTVSGWGMSEVWAFASMSHPTHSPEQRCEASGYPMLDSEFRIVDTETGSDLPDGEQGELLARTYSTMIGYYNKPAETSAMIDDDGWVHTGDLVVMRPDGHLRLIGRCKDMLKVGGENVAPAEIEDRLLELPGVREVAVIGVPDDRLGEVAAAYVTLDNGAQLTLDEVEFHLRGRIASFKIPRYLAVVEAMPMTASGKIRKTALRYQASAAAAPTG